MRKDVMLMVKMNLKALATAIILSGCTLSSSGITSEVAAPSALSENNRVYSLIAAESGTQDLRNAAAALGYQAGEDIPLEGLGLIMVRYDLPQSVTGKQAIDALAAAVPAATVGVNHAYRMQSTSQTPETRTYANTLLRWPQGGCPATMRVGVIDGGVDRSAPKLADTKLVTVDFGQGSAASIRHGTEVASVLADPSRLTNVRLYSANVISPDPSGEDAAGAAQIAQALNWMAEQDVKVVNLSLAGPKNKLLRLASQNASSRGLILVASAGNAGSTAPPQFPAAFDNVVAVTAVDARMNIYNQAVQGTHIDVAAPGVDIFVASASGGRYVTGTSMAAPFVTARIAAQKGASRDTLIADVTDLGPKGKDPVFGYGLINAGAACGVSGKRP